MGFLQKISVSLFCLNPFPYICVTGEVNLYPTEIFWLAIIPKRACNHIKDFKTRLNVWLEGKGKYMQFRKYLRKGELQTIFQITII